MLALSNIRIEAKGVRSLAWDGDSLIDWADGGRRFLLTGEIVPGPVRYSYPFDASATLEGSDYSVVYTRKATKGLVLHQGQVIRELNRSFYHANAYEYPIALFRLPSGREVLAHCPESYCALEIEDIATGEVLTRSNHRAPGMVNYARMT